MSKPRFDFANLDTGAEISDEMGWRYLEVQAHGDTAAELVANAEITAIDQEGADLWTIPLSAAEDWVRVKACEAIDKARAATCLAP